MRLPAKEELCPWTATEKRGPCFLPIFRLETATSAPTRISSLPQGARTRTGHVGSLSRLFLWRALGDTVPTGSQSVVLRPPPRADGVGAEFGGRRVKLGEEAHGQAKGLNAGLVPFTAHSVNVPRHILQKRKCRQNDLWRETRSFPVLPASVTHATFFGAPPETPDQQPHSRRCVRTRLNSDPVKCGGGTGRSKHRAGL